MENLIANVLFIYHYATAQISYNSRFLDKSISWQVVSVAYSNLYNVLHRQKVPRPELAINKPLWQQVVQHFKLEPFETAKRPK